MLEQKILSLAGARAQSHNSQQYTRTETALLYGVCVFFICALIIVIFFYARALAQKGTILSAVFLLMRVCVCVLTCVRVCP